MTAWIHRRKGRIEGEVVWEDDTWAHIRLASDHRLSYYSESNRGRVDEKDEVLTVRKSSLTEIEVKS